MLNKLRREEEGFTLIELLVVVLIIGILAAIALPTFLGQQAKAQNSQAKSNARNLVSQVESCFTEKQDYTGCDASTDLGTTGLPITAGQPGANAPASKSGQVAVTASQTDGYTLTAESKSGDTFTITKAGGGALSYSNNW